ncbi:MAG: hypothetical protein QM802_07695 [Agriterribacter sp.]
MHKWLLIFLCFFSISAFSQQSDFLSLRKNGYTIKNYFKGTTFDFVHVNGSPVSGIIDRIYKDTVYMYVYDVRMSPTPWGTRFADTIGKYDMKFNFKEIAAIPKPSKGFEFIRNGTIFMVGGVAYALLHTVNGLIQKSKIEPRVLAISGGVALVGLTMRKLRKYYYTIGKRYTLEYIQMTSQ